MSSIVDSNITTIIAAIALFSIGTGGVKGFALTLTIGVIISMFTAITVTKSLIKMAYNAGILSKVTYFGVKRG
jgi:preprotein translocase subunit SecD